jgi:lipoate-protein ligase A
LLKSLKHGFESSLGIKLEEGTISDEEQKLAEKLLKHKYSNDRWLKKYE